ncbi:hypothetical protein B0T24DRAFT_594277 [Lasiosphaeria ovina]|uniref:Uncharacterized protein n=1 Tax=Lasiosphaeria ovina TaxID=92902 RepID=A0AAE0KDW9_9PEZI|nr:hypothetical protein B0T24DRAFT_594277 [Lasiosphaeria ovina]
MPIWRKKAISRHPTIDKDNDLAPSHGNLDTDMQAHGTLDSWALDNVDAPYSETLDFSFVDDVYLRDDMSPVTMAMNNAWFVRRQLEVPVPMEKRPYFAHHTSTTSGPVTIARIARPCGGNIVSAKGSKHLGNGNHTCLPGPLAICASLLHMFFNRAPASSLFVWKTIYGY